MPRPEHHCKGLCQPVGISTRANAKTGLSLQERLLTPLDSWIPRSLSTEFVAVWIVPWQVCRVTHGSCACPRPDVKDLRLPEIDWQCSFAANEPAAFIACTFRFHWGPVWC